MRVLFIDDELRRMQAFVEELQVSGCAVDLAEDNRTALSFIRGGSPYDIVVTDIMRDPDSVVGREASDFGLRTGLVFYDSYLRTECPATPVVFFSNSSQVSKLANSSPLCTYLRKVDVLPFELPEILRAIIAKTIELLYEHAGEEPDKTECLALVVDFRAEIKKYLSLHPEKLHDLSPQRFQNLVADILHDMGFDVEETKATRDGGVDIYAYLRHQVANFVMLVECKRWAPDNPVGIDIIQRLHGIQQTKRANKALIVTTSYFTDPARKEAALHESLTDLKDYDAIKEWLKRYSIL